MWTQGLYVASPHGLASPQHGSPVQRSQTSQSQKCKSFVPANGTAALPFATQLRKLCNVTSPMLYWQTLSQVRREEGHRFYHFMGQESEKAEAADSRIVRRSCCGSHAPACTPLPGDKAVSSRSLCRPVNALLCLPLPGLSDFSAAPLCTKKCSLNIRP